MYATVMVGIGPKRLAKRDLSRREGQQKIKAAAGIDRHIGVRQARGPATAIGYQLKGWRRAGLCLPGDNFWITSLRP
jgi:hypothetical protein